MTYQTIENNLAINLKITSNNYQQLEQYISQYVNVVAILNHYNAAEIKSIVGVLIKMAWKSRER